MSASRRASFLSERVTMLSNQLTKGVSVNVSRGDQRFVAVMLILFAIAGMVSGSPQVAMWF